MEIFCPNNHLVLANEVCSKCGWVRQSTRTVGSYRWGPIDLMAGFGGNTVDKHNTFTVVGQTILFVLRSNEIVGVSAERGNIVGRTTLPMGQVIKSVVEHNGKPVIIVQDISSLVEKSEGASLRVVNFKTNEMTDFYRSDSHDNTSPFFTDDQLLIRESSGVLKAIDLQTMTTNWEQEMEGWHTYPLFEAHGNVIVVDGNSAFNDLCIKAFNIRDGEIVWQKHINNQPVYPIISTDEQFFIVQRKSKLMALSTLNGEIHWEFDASRIYTNPVLYGNELVVPIKHSQEGYQIVSLNPETGELIKKIPMETSTYYAPVLDDEMLYTVNGKGTLLAHNWRNGNLSWKLDLVSEYDTVDATPKVVSDTLIVGTYTGKLSAIVIHHQAEKTLTGQELLEKKDFEGAAKAFALAGDFAESARVYYTQLNDANRAMQLLDYGGYFNEAAEIASDKHYYSLALDYYRKAENDLGKAKTYEAMGDPSRAADLYANIGENLKAAKLYEAAGKPQEALHIYIDINALDEYKRLISQVDFSEAYNISSKQLRKMGDYETVAKWAYDNGQYLNASYDFAQAGLYEAEFDSLKRHMEKQLNIGEPVNKAVWLRLAELGDMFDDLAIAGRGWAENNRLELAGQAYYKHASFLASKAADDINQIPDQQREDIAHYFQLASDAFAEEGQDERYAECEQQVRRFRQLPKVVILVVNSQDGFREQLWNELYLTVKNIGFGSARDIDFQLDTKYFLVETESRRTPFNLAAGREQVRKLHIKPLDGARGNNVPLFIRWTYLDKNNNIYNDEGSRSIEVAGFLEDTSKKPIVYNFHNVDTLVTGTVNSLDKSTGDRVEINRREDGGYNMKIRSGDDEIPIGTNPFAKFEIDVHDKCPKCGYEKTELDDYCPNCEYKPVDYDEF